MESLTKELDLLLTEELARIKTDKNARPLVAYNSSFIPVEAIQACGADTFLVSHGGDAGAASTVDEYTIECINPLSRANVSYVINGMDGASREKELIVSAFADNHGGRMSELLEYMGKNVCKIGIPTDWQKDIAFGYYLNALHRMLARVEELTGQEMDREAAAENFTRSNRINELFRRMNRLRKTDRVPIGIEDMILMHHRSLQLSGDRLEAALENAVERLEKAEPRFAPDAPRLILMGRTVAVGDYELLRMIDETGCPVVAEILDETARVLDSDVEPDGDLLESFAKSRYLGRLPTNTFQPSWKQRFEKLRSVIEEYRADGVIWYQIANDEIYDMEYSCVEKWLKEMGIPSVQLETDFNYQSEKQSIRKSRLNSFIKAAVKHQKNRKSV